MKKLLLACSIATLAIASGSASEARADEPGAVPHASQNSWTGFYVGVHAGYGFGEGDGDTSFLPDPSTFGAQPFSSSIEADGFIGGGQAGYDWQFGKYVVGVEADLSWSDVQGDERVSPLSDFGGTPDPAWFQDASVELEWLATLRARAGILIKPNALLYATGGVAYGSVEYETFTSFDPFPQFQYSGSASDQEVGWTAGAGVEWARPSGWSLKAEYLYFDLGETDFVASPLAPNDPFAVTQSFDTTGNVVRFGANYRY